MSSENRKILEETHTRYLDALRHREQDILQYLTILVPAITGFGWVWYKTSGEGFGFFCGAVVTIGILLLGAVYSWALGYNYRYVVFALVKLEKLLDIRKALPVKWQRLPKDFLGGFVAKLKFSGVARKVGPNGGTIGPDGDTILGELIGNDIVENVSLTEVRVKTRNKHRIRKIAGSNFDEIWDILQQSLGQYKPPEMIYVFWVAFIVLIVVVTVMATCEFFFVGSLWWGAPQKMGYTWGIIILLFGAICFWFGFMWTPKCFGKKLYKLYEGEKDWTEEGFFPAPFRRGQ